jgi:hypothetical protein
MMQQELRIRTLEDSVRVGEAAAILGVSTKTLPTWDRTGKVRARRHPVNGYRIYLRQELEELLNQTADPELPAAGAGPERFPGFVKKG